MGNFMIDISNLLKKDNFQFSDNFRKIKLIDTSAYTDYINSLNNHKTMLLNNN